MTLTDDLAEARYTIENAIKTYDYANKYREELIDILHRIIRLEMITYATQISGSFSQSKNVEQKSYPHILFDKSQTSHSIIDCEKIMAIKIYNKASIH